MSKTEEEKTIELVKKAKDFIPDGGYSEKELILAFYMFIKGYQQAEKDLELTLEDVVLFADILYNESFKYYPPIKPEELEEYYKEVLKRFKEHKINKQ